MLVLGGGRCSLHIDRKMRLYSWVLGIQEGRRYEPLLGIWVGEEKVSRRGMWVVWRCPGLPPRVAVAD